MKKHSVQDISEIFPPQNSMTRDILVSLENKPNEEIRNVLKGYLDPFWTFPRLTSEQIDILHAIIYPENAQ